MTSACGLLLSLFLAQLPPSDLDRIQVGNTAPDFTLQAADGRTLSLASLRGKTVVLVFYRGYW